MTPAANKAKIIATTNGSILHATRLFDTNFTSGKVYFYWIQNFDHSGGANSAYAGLYIMSTNQEEVLIGKTPGDDKLGIAWWAGEGITNSSRTIANGTGNDYLIVARYDFDTYELSANVYSTNEVIGEEPRGYWDVSVTLGASDITFINGVRIKGGVHSDPVNNIGNVYFDEIRVGTNWYEVARKDGEEQAVDMANGPLPKLLYVGTNYNPALNPQGASSDITINDGQLADTDNPLDFAVMWTNVFGVWITNANGTLNLSSREGRVSPNWDPVYKAGEQSTEVGMDAFFTNFVGYNGALTVTTYVHAAFNITNATVGDTFFVSMSAENNNLDGGSFAAPNEADDVPYWRAITVNSNVEFFVTDDDSTYPTIVPTNNELANPGFEIGDGINIDSWTQTERAWIHQQSTYEGTNSVQYVTGDGSVWGNLWQGIDASAGKIYVAALYARIDSGSAAFEGTNVYIKIEFHANAGGDLISDSLLNIRDQMTTDWQYFTFAATSPPSTVHARISLGWEGESGLDPVTTAYIDNVSFSEAGPPLYLRIGSTNYPASEGFWTNALFSLTDSDLASVSAVNPLSFVLRALDADDEGDSGLSRGTTEPETQTHLTIENITTADVTSYVAGASSPYEDTVLDTATSTWQFTSFSDAQITALLAYGSNEVYATVRDADNDRVNDRLSVTNMRFGFLSVSDDDTDYPLGGNLLQNPSFEIGNGGYGAMPSNWWGNGEGGNEAWSEVRTGTNVYGFWSWKTNWYANFGQDAYVDVDDGDVLTFTIWGRANPGFASSNSEAWILLELWTGGSLTHTASNSIYAQLVGNPDTWTQYRLVYTNTTDGITLVKPIVGSGGWDPQGGSESLMFDDASLALDDRGPLIVSVDDYYASVIDDYFDGTDIKYQWYWEAEEGTKAGVNNALYFWPTNAYRQAAIGSRHSYPWVDNVAYTYQFTIEEMFDNDNFFVSLFLVGDDAGVQPYPYSDYNNANVLLLQVADFDTGAGRNWGVKLYLKTESPFVAAYDTSDPGVVLLADTYSLTYVTNTTFGFTLDDTNLTLFVSSEDDDVTIVTNLTAAQMAYFSDQAYVHVAGRNDNGSAVPGDQAILSNVRVMPHTYAPDAFFYVLTDGDLAYVDGDNPFRLTFPAFDTGSGLSRGTDSVATQMHITVSGLTTNNVTEYQSDESSAPEDTTSSTATSVWKWTDITSDQIQSLMNAWANPISATLRDADFDRADDQLSLTNVQYGLLRVIDDDESYPRFSSMDVPGGSRTNLRAGDIVVMHYQATDPDTIGFVPLVDIVGGTVVYFTDQGWQSAGGFRAAAGEGVLTWVSPASVLSAGTIVMITNASSTDIGVTQGTVSRSSGGFAMALAGDQVLVYQSSDTSTTFLFAVTANDSGWSDATDNTTTALPTGLTDGINAVNIASSGEYDNGYYDGSVHGGTTYSIGDSVSDAGDWTVSDSILTSTWWCSVFNPDVYVEFTDEGLASGISITGLVSDGYSGLYKIGDFANSPTAMVYNTSGAWTYGAYFTNGPATDGDGQADEVGLAVSGLVLQGDMGSVVTVKVVVTDYDVDRSGDSLCSTQLVMVRITSDDDTNAPISGVFQPGNLLRNSSFDWVHEDGTAQEALYWTLDERSTFYSHGGAWGSGCRQPWREYPPDDNGDSVSNCAAIGGVWYDGSTNGGLWQEVPNEMGEGVVWEASAWVWSDASGVTWTCEWQAIFIEFWDAGSSNLLTVTNIFASPGETWTKVSVVATSPADAVYARWVMGAWDVSQNGSLSIDSASLRVVTNTTMDFLIGRQSFYRADYGSNGLFRVTDGDLARISNTNQMKFVFNVYDPDSGLIRSATNEDLNFDVGSETELQNIYWTYSAAMSSEDTTSGSSTSVFAHGTNFTITVNYDPQTGMVWTLMGFTNSGATNAITLSGLDADNDRANDGIWITNHLNGFLSVSDDDDDGPFHWLHYIGTNFEWGSYNTNPISDADMLDFQFAYGIWDASGILVTNHLSGSTNVWGDKGEIAPNWDIVWPNNMTNIENAVPAPGQIHSPRGNSSYNATVVVQNVTISYEQNTIGVWRIQASAQDMDWDRGTYLRTNVNEGVETISWDRAHSGDWQMEFTVYDDDEVTPLITSNANGRPLGVWLGTSNVVGSTDDTNAIFTVTDGDLAHIGGENLVQNSGFETGDFTDWWYWGQDWRIADTGWVWDVHSGIYGVVNDVITNYRNDTYRVLEQEIPASEGEIFSASAYIRCVSPQESAGWLELQFWGPGGSTNVLLQDQSTHVESEQDYTLYTIDDFTAPALTETISVRCVVWCNTNIDHLATNNDHFIFDDIMLKKGDSQPFRLVFSVYDGTSALRRDTSNPESNMNVSVGAWVESNVANLAYLESTSDSSTDGTTNVWKWSMLGPYDIWVLYSGSINRVSAAVPDADNDRLFDQAWLEDQQFGWLEVLDDDSTNPVLSGLQVVGTGGALEESGSLVYYDFDTDDETPAFDTNAQYVANRLTEGGFANDPGPIGSSAGNPEQAAASSGWLVDRYYYFTVVVEQGFQMTVTNIMFHDLRSGTGPSNWFVFCSADSYGSALAAGTNLTTSWTTNSEPVSYSVLTGTNTFRVAATNAGGSSGTWRLDNFRLQGVLQPLAGAGYVSDADLATGAWTITGLVQDVDSGVFATGHPLGPIYDLYDPNGVQLITNQSFATGPDTNGAAREETALSDTMPALDSDSIVFGTYTGYVYVSDYDDDRVFDTLSVTQMFTFTVLDDDEEAPEDGTIFQDISHLYGPMVVYHGEDLAGSGGAGTNRKWYLTDQMLVNAATTNIEFHFNIFDASGYYRSSTEGGSNMTVTIERFVTNDYSHYDADLSSADTVNNPAATSVWNFTSFSDEQMTALMETTSRVSVCLTDMDNDRTDDSASVTNLQTGYVVWRDNDPLAPALQTHTNFGSNALHVVLGSDPDNVFSNLWLTNSTPDDSANQVYLVSDGQLAQVADTNQLLFRFHTFDVGVSILGGAVGMQRGTTLTTEESGRTLTNTHVSIGTVIESNTAGYVAEWSSPFSHTKIAALFPTSYWAFTQFTYDQVGQFLPSGTESSNQIILHAYDVDNDRNYDQASTNLETGWLVVYDDDPNKPAAGGLRCNLLRNPSFEEATNGYSTYWADNFPDDHGNIWGNWSRTNTHPLSGSWNMAIPSLWGDHPYAGGGAWQEVTNEAGGGAIWEASVHVWKDAAWTADWVRLKIEFWDGESNGLGGGAEYEFDPPSETWAGYSTIATAPVNAAWVRWVIQAEGTVEGITNIHLHYDDVALGVVTSMPLLIQIGTSNYLGSDATTNAEFSISDGELAGVSTNSLFRMFFGAYDADSGLLRGNTDASTQMNITVGSWISANVTNYSASDSSSDAATLHDGAMSTWKWDDFDRGTIGALYSAGTSLISATLFDADDDRAGDRLTNVNQRFGFLVVYDDDLNAPALGVSGVTNLLRNSDFETDGSSEYVAWGWEAGNPDGNGGVWGNCYHPSDWPQARSGTDLGAIPGKWATMTYDYGGWWQQVSNGWEAGTVWELGAWLWNDDGTGGPQVWTANYAHVQIEFRASDDTLLGSNNLVLPPGGYGEEWTWVSVLATAPTDAAWARFVIFADGVAEGDVGALQFEDVVLRPLVPFGVQVGDRYIRPDNGDTSTNAVFTITDHDLVAASATNPFKLIFGTYDAEGGLSRGNEGATTQMNVTVANLITDDVSKYAPTVSTPFDETTSEDAYSVWMWEESITAFYAQNMMDAGSNEVTAVIFDADDDRDGDRMSLADQRFGFLRVVDNDTSPPVASNLMIKGVLVSNETAITDQELYAGNWHIQVTIYDESGIATTNVDDYWAPNFSLVNPSGDVVVSEQDFRDGITTGDGLTYTCWRTWAGNVDYYDVETGYWHVVWSARDVDEDRDGDWSSITNSEYIWTTSNRFMVVDDDTADPTAPSNVVVTPAYWTNVNYFAVTWSPGYDASGIYQYRAYTNASVPHWTNGYLLAGGLVVTSPISHSMSNMNFEMGENDEVVPRLGEEAPWAWLNFGASTPLSDGWWDSSDAQSGTNSMRVQINPPGQQWALIGQDVEIENEENYGGEVQVAGWFKGDLSASSGAGAFLKLEFYDEDDSLIPPAVGNEYDDGYNGRPFFDTNVANWTYCSVTATSMPPSARTIRVMAGLNNFSSGLAYTGWWDNISLTVRLVSASGAFGGIFTNAPEGVFTNYVYSVDADNDRVEDRQWSEMTNFITMLDVTAPLAVSNVNGEAGLDPTSEVFLQWDPLPDGGGTDLSPWYTYRVYYTDEARDATNTDSYVDITTGGPDTLGTNTTSSLVLSNLVFGQTYHLAVVGIDVAGNEGPLSTDQGSATLAGFFVTQGVVVATAPAELDLAWTAASDGQGGYKTYDLLYVDALQFTDSLSNQWKLVGQIAGTHLSDKGGTNSDGVVRCPPGDMVDTMRFYRVAQKDIWRTNFSPRVASEEIYAMKTLQLHPGQNWVALPFIPDSNSLEFVLGTDQLPGGTIMANSTRVQWFQRIGGEQVSNAVWLSSDHNWYTYHPTSNWLANTMCIPLHEGFVVEIPTNESVQTVVCIGRVPTNTMTQTVPTGSYSLVSVRMPRRVHPSELKLYEAGFQGALSAYDAIVLGNGDRLWKYDRVNQRVPPGEIIWYNKGTGIWYFLNMSQVPANYFAPDDGIVIFTPAAYNSLEWTPDILYSPPTRRMSP
ncbi:MAG: hypothetical protein JXB04_10070 [Kiritimatiellae bacterium]|nr:hypothetical protein [Kiritimatiellia bacterium]